MKHFFTTLACSLSLAMTACGNLGGNGNDDAGITPQNSTQFVFKDKLFQKGTRKNGIETTPPSISEADYYYLCLNEFDGTSAKERAQKSHALAMSPQFASQTRLFSGKIGKQYQSNSASRSFSKNIDQLYGCRMTRIKTGRIITTDLDEILTFVLGNQIKL